ncbi:MAG: phosphoribosylaminoimidazolesuccinocarboxamide synthase [SAR202 cluster bacterium]|nr:phosphoribosylaminoimidazolesuccinocarboxamide synthase [SAR202 cluster bacterium]
MNSKSVKHTNLKNKIHSGKVRDIYEIDEDKLLFVATDRISAFDVIMEQTVPGKGIVLNNLSSFWFDFFNNYNTHYISKAQDFDFSNTDYDEIIDVEILKRSTVVKKAERIDMECVVRGYITGSAWNEYKSSNSVNFKPIMDNLLEAEKFKTPIFTPSTKAEEGHDEALSEKEGKNLVGSEIYSKLEYLSIDLYSKAAKFCENKGILLADTKFEFGFIDDQIILIDEVLTPDSSRFWKSSEYRIGNSPDPFDKQFLRNWLNDQVWDKTPPPPDLPDEVIKNTLKRYLDIYEIITNDNLE